MEQPEIRKLRNPAVRGEVAIALRYLCDLDYQQRVWCKREAPEHRADYFSFHMAVNTLYDDAQLEGEAAAAVGDVLRDDAEARAVDALIAALERVFEEVGGADADPCVMLKRPSWQVVLDAARAAARLVRPEPGLFE